jgi:leader peptidase (prepilin peptidase)/N-methyltransferase
MFPSASWLLAFVIGAATGSFLNMLIYRLPRRLSFSQPPKSFCPKCKHSLSAIDLFPLLSWLSTKGRCRYCKEPIATRYFLVEIITAALFSGIWFQFMIVGDEPIKMVFYMAATAALVAIIFIDWELYVIPDEINAFLLVLGIGLGAITHTLSVAFWGAIAGWAILWGIALLGRLLFGKDAMGHGDIKMMRGVGSIIGPTLILANMAIAVIAGLVIGLAVIGFAKKSSAEEEEDDTPYVPESILSLLKFGFFYLVCLDILGIFWHGAYGLIGEKYEEENIEDDTWTPSLTTIPFGPYLAAGALACMIFAVPLENGIRQYWKTATGSNQTAMGPSDAKYFVDSHGASA